MKLDDVLEMWKTDCKINEVDLGTSSLETAQLHGKYVELLAQAKLKKKIAEQKQMTLLKSKFLYYNGKLSQEQLEEYGWKPDPLEGIRRPSRQDMEYFYNADKDIQKTEAEISYYTVLIDTVKDIVDVLKWRHQTIRNILEFRKFEAGF